MIFQAPWWHYEEFAEEEDSLDKELNANVSEQQSVEADQNEEATSILCGHRPLLWKTTLHRLLFPLS